MSAAESQIIKFKSKKIVYNSCRVQSQKTIFFKCNICARIELTYKREHNIKCYTYFKPNFRFKANSKD